MVEELSQNETDATTEGEQHSDDSDGEYFSLCFCLSVFLSASPTCLLFCK